MREDGAVSLWVGYAASAESLDHAMNIAYSDDGDELGSAFGRGFGLPSYDDDFRESEYLAHGPSTLTGALEGCSYSAEITPLFVKLTGDSLRPTDNCCVLLYDYRYDGSASQWDGEGVSLRFLGNVRYR